MKREKRAKKRNQLLRFTVDFLNLKEKKGKKIRYQYKIIIKKFILKQKRNEN